MKTSNPIMTGLVISTLAASAAFGQGVGNLGSLPTQFFSPAPITGWSVDSGNAANPWLPVQISPTGPQWVKLFTGLNGQPITAVPGQTFSLQELLLVAPPQSWTDWHEDILTPGWDWVSPTLFLANFAPPGGLNTVITPGNNVVGGTIDFTFNPLVPGTLIDIRKTLQYNGTSVFTGKIQIAEYPTPEPATLVFLALGSVGLWRRRNRTSVA